MQKNKFQLLVFYFNTLDNSRPEWHTRRFNEHENAIKQQNVNYKQNPKVAKSALDRRFSVRDRHLLKSFGRANTDLPVGAVTF